jgi:hypothetical protein
LINGVGIAHPSRVKTSRVHIKKCPAIRIDGTQAVGMNRGELKGVNFCGRLFLLLDTPAVLIVDSVILQSFGQVESRIYTDKENEFLKDRVYIKEEKSFLQVVFDSSVSCSLYRSISIPTLPEEGTNTMIRWCTDKLNRYVAFATLLFPGREKASVETVADKKSVNVKVKIKDETKIFRITSRLNCKRS